jgi:LemA protein
MEQAYSEEKFAEHIRTIVKEAEGDSLTERPLTLPELKELAMCMGMREDEWDQLQIKAETSLKLAQNHLAARNFDEAIREAEKATAINPYLANSNSILAKSYQMLWLEDQNDQARTKAIYHAQKELLTDPEDQVAINVLSAVNKDQKNGLADAKTKKTYLYIGLGILALIIVLFFAFSGGDKSSNTSGNPSNSDLENQLIVANEEVKAKYDLVQTAIDQRNSMLPELFDAVDENHADLNALNAEIESLQTTLENLKGDEKFNAEKKVEDKIKEAKKLIKQYGNAQSVEILMVQIEGAENRISFEKKAYNEAVKNYNILVKQSKGEYPEYQEQAYYNAE